MGADAGPAGQPFKIKGIEDPDRLRLDDFPGKIAYLSGKNPGQGGFSHPGRSEQTVKPWPVQDAVQIFQDIIFNIRVSICYVAAFEKHGSSISMY
jgi:hypothetical protein